MEKKLNDYKRCAHLKKKTFHLFKINGEEILLCCDCEREAWDLMGKRDLAEKQLKDFVETLYGKEVND